MPSPDARIRDAVFQPMADACVRHLGIGPFTVSKTLMRAAMVATPALDTAAFARTLEARPWTWVFDLISCAILYGVSLVPAEAAKRPPRPGQATACGLRHDYWRPVVGLVLMMAPAQIVALIYVTTATSAIALTAGLLSNAGFMMGTTLWKDLPRHTRAPLPAPVPS